MTVTETPDETERDQQQALKAFILALVPRTRTAQVSWASYLHHIADLLYQRAIFESSR